MAGLKEKLMNWWNRHSDEFYLGLLIITMTGFMGFLAWLLMTTLVIVDRMSRC